MATLASTGRFAAGERCAHIDLLYGPYASVEEAHAALYDTEQNVIGRTVGILDSTTGTVTEYWYQGGTTQQHLVPKQTAGGSDFSGSYNDLTDKPTFKTVGGQSILGTGDIAVSGGGSTPAVPQAVSHSGAVVTIATLDGGTVHTCTDALDSLTIAALGQNQTVEATLLFTTSADWEGLTMPAAVKYAPMKPVLTAGRSYVMSVQNGICVVSEVTE